MTSAGPAFLYVLPTPNEDLLKLGFSRDPLARMQALHPRFFEFFDLERAFAVETETVREVRDLENRYAHALRVHRAPAPLTATRAGGHREWYRGALAQLEHAAGELDAAGFRVLRPLAPWVRMRLEAAAPSLHAWTALLGLDELQARGSLAVASIAQRRVLDVLDAYHAFELELARWLPGEVLAWHAQARRHGSAT